MGELRRDPIIGQWVIVAGKDDSLKPEDYPKEKHVVEHAAICQFCPGRENQTPPEVDAIRPGGSRANSSGWWSRVIPNKFPALKIEGNLGKRGDGIYDLSNGIGAHEVLIETSDHYKQLADLAPEEIANVIKLAQNRSLSLAKDKRFRYVMIFKNYGESAGASVEHSHSQIIALPMVPKTVVAELEGAKNYFGYRGRCVYCDIIQQEIEDEERIVTQNEHFIAFCPYVPRYPFESWIVPKEHNSRFCLLNDPERFSLASILKETLMRIKIILSDPSYNFYLHVTPLNYKDEETYHWHIEIIPKLSRVTGHEWGTGFYVVHTCASVAAGFLRDASVAVS